MAIKDYWIYQQADVATPWAIYMVKEYLPNHGKEFITLDWTLYHEDIQTPERCKSFIGLHCDTIEEYANAIIAEMASLVPVASSDFEQIKREIESILIS